MARVKAVTQLTIPQFEAMFPDEDACKNYLQARRWPEGIRCARCGNDKVYPAANRPFHWQCSKCSPTATSYRFSVITGTIFENTNKPLRDWFRVIHMMLTSKKGVSALQVKRVMGFGSYETALYMCNRIRAGLSEDSEKLGGIVEVDETFIGGKAKNRHAKDRDGGPGPTASGKTAVAGAVSRKGKVVARVIKNVKRSTLEGFVREAVSDKVSLLVTDHWVGYSKLGDDYPHAVIDHASRAYVVGAVHTNTIEGFWSLIKRGAVGTYHKISKKYLPLYVAEFQFRYNNRENVDIFGAAIARC